MSSTSSRSMNCVGIEVTCFVDGRLLWSGSWSGMPVGSFELMSSLWVQFVEDCLSSSEPLPDSVAIECVSEEFTA